MEEWVVPLISGIVILVLVLIWWAVPLQSRANKNDWSVPIVVLVFVTCVAASVFVSSLLAWAT